MTDTRRVALVTGATSDIGAAISRSLAAGTFAVAVAYHADEAAGWALTRELQAAGARATAVAVDLGAIESLVAARDEVEEVLGPVDVLVNCAARVHFSRFLDSDPSEWAGDVDITLLGTMRACHVFAPRMSERGWGRIVNIVAEGALVGEPALAVATAAKAGVLGLTRTLARELGPHGITVNAVSPGFVPTAATPEHLLQPDRLEQIARSYPMGRLGRPEDIAAMVACLAGEEIGYVTGQTISVSGGYSVR
jgi:2-hydroxycyclohexanecarboxyl-CoA dehydrogenase